MNIVAGFGMIAQEDFGWSGLAQGAKYETTEAEAGGFFITLNGASRWFHRAFFNMTESRYKSVQAVLDAEYMSL